MQQSRRAVLTGLAGAAVALPGCLSRSGRDSGGGSPGSQAGTVGTSKTSETSTSGTPEYATCWHRTPADQNSRGFPPDLPENLSEANVGEYARSFEELYQTNYENLDDGGITVGSVVTEMVDHGFVVHIEVESGFVSYGTAHADFTPYTASYFINERVVRRFESDDGPVDPREAGIVRCRPD